jgi:hypothetical protein
MILKSPTSRTAIVNLFADFILSKIPHNKHTIIQVADCINFFVIKGKTSYNDLLNIGEILDEFKEKFNLSVSDGRKLSHTINLIEYNIEMTEKAKDFIVEHGYDEKCGARPLKRAIQKFIEDPLAEEIIRANLQEGDKIKMDVEDGAEELNIKIEKGKAKAKSKE